MELKNSMLTQFCTTHTLTLWGVHMLFLSADETQMQATQSVAFVWGQGVVEACLAMHGGVNLAVIGSKGHGA